MKRPCRRLIVEPDRPALIALGIAARNRMSTPPRVNTHALRQRSHNRCHPRRTDEPRQHLHAIFAAFVRPRRPSRRVSRSCNLVEIAAEIDAARRHILCAVIKRMRTLPQRSDPAADDPFLFKNLNITASTAHSLRTCKSCQSRADYCRLLRHLRSPETAISPYGPAVAGQTRMWTAFVWPESNIRDQRC